MNQPVTPPMTEQHSAHERCDILIIGAVMLDRFRQSNHIRV